MIVHGSRSLSMFHLLVLETNPGPCVYQPHTELILGSRVFETGPSSVAQALLSLTVFLTQTHFLGLKLAHSTSCFVHCFSVSFIDPSLSVSVAFWYIVSRGVVV